MAMQEMEKLNDQTVDELKGLYRDLSKEIFDLKNEAQMAQKMEKPHALRHKKRDRARVLTVLRQKGGSIT